MPCSRSQTERVNGALDRSRRRTANRSSRVAVRRRPWGSLAQRRTDPDRGRKETDLANLDLPTMETSLIPARFSGLFDRMRRRDPLPTSRHS